ncbi:Erv1 / Alr family protein [Toxoplasma gondii VAND]|uniref:Sulfhydryl oxidase n=2 Tax=Toxoplasma gondii TaxID=5811 RepID=A0A086QXH3_TOXGO|nr:Erv1 / Alr family protein [Toxoplasma gondii VAND]KFH17305.1 Erv1 / Alr family protein [Toxoplasma gondii MAS]
MGNSAGAYSFRNQQVSATVPTSRESSLEDGRKQPSRSNASTGSVSSSTTSFGGQNANTSPDSIGMPTFGVEGEGVDNSNGTRSVAVRVTLPAVSGGGAHVSGVTTAPAGVTPQGAQISIPSVESGIGPESDAQRPSMHPPIHFCAETNDPQDPCNAQWLLLWTYAAYASPRPSAEEQRHLRVFFEEFPDQCTFGPAARCYSEAVKTFPPRVESRRDLMLWLCLVENQCRLKLDMPTRPCRYSELVRRWRYDDGYL